jgi:hypothetical protein
LGNTAPAPAGELCISLLIILSFAPILLFGAYLIWDPDFDLVSYLVKNAIAGVLAPFLPEDGDREGEGGRKLDQKQQDSAGKKMASDSPKPKPRGGRYCGCLCRRKPPQKDDEDDEEEEDCDDENPTKQEQLEAVEIAIELVMNPNLDAEDDIARMSPENQTLVAAIVDLVRKWSKRTPLSPPCVALHTRETHENH